MNDPHHILVVNVNWLGDVIFSTAVFRNLKQHFPQAKIACLAVPRVQAVLECCPDLDEIIIYDEQGSARSLWGKGRLVWRLRQEKFDGVFLLHRSWTRAVLMFLAGIRTRVGYDTKKRGAFLTHPVPLPSSGQHRADVYLGVLEGFGLDVRERGCELSVDRSAAASLQDLLQDAGVSSEDFVLVVKVGGNWDLKRWPQENFVELIDNISQHYKIKIVLPGAAKDVPVAREIAARCQITPWVLAGKTDLKQLLALMQRADAVISADTGPMHMASSLGTDGIAIFGPTRPEITGPRGPGHFTVLQQDVGCNRSACYFLRCPDNVCMSGMTPEVVFSEFRRRFETQLMQRALPDHVASEEKNS